MAIMALTDLLVLVLLGLTRVPLVFAGPAWAERLAPSLMFYLSPLEKGILTFSSLMFLIFAGERFLQTVSIDKLPRSIIIMSGVRRCHEREKMKHSYLEIILPFLR